MRGTSIKAIFSLCVTFSCAYAQQQFGDAIQASVSSTGVSGGDSSDHCQLGQDSRYVVFDSLATNLVSPSTSNRQIFLRDVQQNKTELISMTAASATSGGNAASEFPSISADGNYIVFHSAASDLVNGDTNNFRDIFIRNRNNPSSTTRVNIGANGSGNTQTDVQGNGDSTFADVSDDGRFVVFLSEASNLITIDNDTYADIFVVDRQAGTIKRLSIGMGDTAPNGSSNTGRPAISADGKFVVFGSFASNLVASDNNGQADIFVANVATGAIELISIPPTDETFSNTDSFIPMGPGSISADGRFVGFGLDSDGDAFADKLYIRDRTTQVTKTVSKNEAGDIADNYTDNLRFSASAQGVAFFSPATNLVAEATSGGTFFLDRGSNQLRLIAGNTSGDPCVSDDGATVGYFEPDQNLSIQQIYIRSSDACSSDPAKIDPGVCGCGVADTDSDNDGTPNCNDLCPNDTAKIALGICGCGVADTDSDNDGTPDCNDACDNDNTKTTVGICGCGVADTDSDNDGTADCADACPTDALKIAAGTCGCGKVDTAGCGQTTDTCPLDPLKTAPGTCGCGVADTDSDNDGTPDCNDTCSNDSSKTSKGICGCGVADSDKNNTRIPDCFEKGGKTRLPAPTLVVDKKTGKVAVKLTSISGLRFEISVMRGRTTVFSSRVKSNNMVLRDIPNGKYSFMYSYISVSGKKITRSRNSAKVNFQITIRGRTVKRAPSVVQQKASKLFL